MRKPIQRLPRELAEKIAAGEVVERPGSVIKELVENSIDAGATEIEVQIQDGGKRKITVKDNGLGIPDDQTDLALERHATSKVQKLDDLFNIKTMGFRGEALPSIATVSRFTLETRSNKNKGKRLYLEGGKNKKNTKLNPTHPLAMETGTQIFVEDLFFNVPARLKFLKAKTSESSFIRDQLERTALAYPKTQFKLISEGRKTFHVKKGQSPEERVASIFKTSKEDIESFESQYGNTQIKGWLDRNSRASNSRSIYLSINGRMVRDKLLQQAILVALRPRMMEGEYPKIYIELTLPPTEVDVNVHPAKTEVRFRKSRDIFQIVHGALEKLAVKPKKAFYEANLKASEPKLFETRSTFKTKVDNPWISNPSRSERMERTEEPREETAIPRLEPSSTPGFEKLHYIGQLKNTYLLFQDEKGLIVVDQHAAHERLRYESIKSVFLEEGLKAQPLLVSMTVKCTPEEQDLALAHKEMLQKIGFEVESFGKSLIVRSSPEGLEPKESNELFKAVLEELKSPDTAKTLSKDPSNLTPKIERLLATSACHSSVRAGQALSPNEAKTLVKEMDITDSSLNCPHGRPTSIRLKFSQIEGLFKRV